MVRVAVTAAEHRHRPDRPRVAGWGVPVAESALAPPGPIPNPVVTQRSAGEYCGGDPVGGEAAADTPHPDARVRGQTSRDGKSRDGRDEM